MMRSLVLLLASTHVAVNGNQVSLEADDVDVDDLMQDSSLLQHAELTVEGGKSVEDAKATEISAKAETHVEDAKATGISLKAAMKEFIAMTLFVIIGCGSAMGVAKIEGSAWILQVSLTFGFAITALASATGGQINCAVTFGLVILGKLSIAQAGVNLVAQLAGSVCGAAILHFMYDKTSDNTGGLGSNGVNKNPAKDKDVSVVGVQYFTWQQALIGEIIMTFLLMFTVCHVALIDKSVTATVAIGFAVFLAHSVLIPIDGCSINPTRSFGPAVVASMTNRKNVDGFEHMVVFCLGPLLGAGLAAGLVLMSGDIK